MGHFHARLPPGGLFRIRLAEDSQTLIKQAGSAMCAAKNSVSNSDQRNGEQ
jgi:hypothetical protein